MPNCIKILYIVSGGSYHLQFKDYVLQLLFKSGQLSVCVGVCEGGKKENTNFWGNCKPNFQTLYVATKIHADYIGL